MDGVEMSGGFNVPCKYCNKPIDACEPSIFISGDYRDIIPIHFHIRCWQALAGDEYMPKTDSTDLFFMARLDPEGERPFYAGNGKEMDMSYRRRIQQHLLMTSSVRQKLDAAEGENLDKLGSIYGVPREKK
jgi:hypothetical protein